MGILQRLKPRVNKSWLNLLAGLMWSCVGIMLGSFAARFLKSVPRLWWVPLIITGLLLAYCIFRFGFSRFARKNIDRIQEYQNDRICVFAFQAWTSYPLVAVMIALGIYLRVLSPFPRWLLAILYLGIGGSLFMASFLYYGRLLPMASPHHPKPRT